MSATTLMLHARHSTPAVLLIGVLLLCLQREATAQGWIVQNSGTTRHLYGACIPGMPTMFVTGAQGTLLRSSDGGSTWHAVASGTSQDLHTAAGIFPMMYAAGALGTLLVSSDFGLSWVPRFSGTTAVLRGCLPTSATACMLVGDAGQIRTSSNAGLTWMLRTPGLRTNILDIDAAGPGGTVFVSGDSGAVLHSVDSGMNWTSGNTGFFTNHNGIAFATASIGVMVGRRGSIARTTDGGLSWRSVPAVTSQDLLAVDFGDSLQGGACGTGGVILHTSDAGATWSQQFSPVTSTLRAITFSDIFNGLAVGDNGVLLRTSNGGVPVELRSFGGMRTGTHVRLEWSTETEHGNAGFDIERRVCAVEASPEPVAVWEQRGTVAGAGTTLMRQTYTFDDHIPSSTLFDTLVYRLRQRDTDGSASLSTELRLVPERDPASDNDATAAVVAVLGPQPARDALTFAVNLAAAGGVQIIVVDAAARRVTAPYDLQLSHGTHIVRMPVAHLPAGSYVSLVTAGGRITAHPIRIIH